MAEEIKQVGGTHYGTKFGHWDYCKLARTPYLEGAATKYLFRWRGKNGIQDLEKGFTFLQKLLVGMDHFDKNPDPQAIKHLAALQDLFDQNNVPSAERLLMQALLTWRTYNDLLWVKDQYANFLEEQRVQEADGNYTNQG